DFYLAHARAPSSSHMSQDDTSVSEVEAFCSNEECREPIVVVDEGGHVCQWCKNIFCDACIDYLAKELDLQYFLRDADGFCPECIDTRREELSPDSDEGRHARAKNT